jgi:RNA polymerase primary sigma factor
MAKGWNTAMNRDLSYNSAAVEEPFESEQQPSDELEDAPSRAIEDEADVEPEAEPEEEVSEAAYEDSYAPESNLSLYFRDMSGLDVLGPEQEVQIAKEIEQLTIELWSQAFAYAPMLATVEGIVRLHVTDAAKHFRSLNRQAATLRSKSSPVARERYHQAALTAAERIATVDFDDLALNDTLFELRRVRDGFASRIERTRGPSTRTQVYRNYMCGVESGARALQDAKHRFVVSNLRLVVSIARRFNKGRMALADLIQEGNIGLMKAVERFDYRRGFRFSTYASWWIRHAISRALADKGRAVRLPVHMIDTYQKLSRTQRDLQTRLGRKPTSEEVSEGSGIALGKIQRMNSYLLEQSISLDRPVNDDDGRKFIDLMTDVKTSTNTADTLIHQVLTDEAIRVMDELTPIEADILRRRFGLGGEDEETLKEIGEHYCLSRERIRQLQEQALGKVRRALRRKDLL